MCDRTEKQQLIVLACGASGAEVQEAFNTNVGSRSKRQIEIVRRIVANGAANREAVSAAWDKSHKGEVICASPPRIVRGCATRADCDMPPQELTIREAKTVDMSLSKAAGKEIAEAWSNVWKDKVQAYTNLE